jgi:hypothetical protein
MEDDMSEMEMTNAVETEEEFTDELSDEALDREQGGGKYGTLAGNSLAPVRVTDR